MPQDDFAGLTWADLEDWAGTAVVGRGQSYARGASVADLSLSPDGGLIAWVRGTSRYATSVWMIDGELHAVCTCPFTGPCKHAVAVVLVYLEARKKKRTIPNADPDDPRITIVKDAADLTGVGGEKGDIGGEGEDWEEAGANEEDKEIGRFDEEEDDDDDEDEENIATDAFDRLIEKASKAELGRLLKGIAVRHPEIARASLVDKPPSRASADKLVKAVRRTIVAATSEPAWHDYRSRRAEVPDFESVRDGFGRLLEAGRADDVVELGEMLLKRGQNQVGEYDDEGELALEISGIMDVVFRALAEGSLPDADKMIKAFGFVFGDEYDLCSGVEAFWRHPFPRSAWSEFADRLAARPEVAEVPGPAEKLPFERSCPRDVVSDMMILALEKAGRADEIIPLCIREAPLTGSYKRLVTRLRAGGRAAEAEEWCRKGIADTAESMPGIAGGLRKEFLELRRDGGDAKTAAAVLAEEFFREPDVGTYRRIRKILADEDAWPAVRLGLLAYLEKGTPARPGGEDGGGGVSAAGWPLPVTGLAMGKPRGVRADDRAYVRLEIALEEKNIEDAIRIYDQLSKSYGGGGGWREGRGGGLIGWASPFWSDIDDRFADAIAGTHPDRAIAIWKRQAESLIAMTKPKAYESASHYLRKVKKRLTTLNRRTEWEAWERTLRMANFRKRRFIEVLDRLSSRPIIES